MTYPLNVSTNFFKFLHHSKAFVQHHHYFYSNSYITENWLKGAFLLYYTIKKYCLNVVYNTQADGFLVYLTSTFQQELLLLT